MIATVIAMLMKKMMHTMRREENTAVAADGDAFVEHNHDDYMMVLMQLMPVGVVDDCGDDGVG